MQQMEEKMTSSASLALNHSTLIRQIENHPFWKNGREEQLRPGECLIVRRDDLSFCLIWLNKDGEKKSVPFRIKGSEFFFQNGQMWRFNQIHSLITEIFKHF
jgi:hypothetical protein